MTTKRKPGEQLVAPLPATLVQPRRGATAPADAYAGQGGSYVLDPATGKRTLVERTFERGDLAPPADEKE
ncbi:hypothetical protein [Thauera propionica]|jgi:hypothetical protein|uniref:hypothetical protein n=1 Tax=Thauera propionica TaxID=2019431 RepID=UPI0023F42A8C|nr:hypothetical protein [Thauera propionica]MDD3675805.1 hypothetical protein [Thauera propionica]